MYDDAGRMTESVTQVEPEWDAESYGLVAALADYKESLCPRCGEPLDECMSADADPDNPAATHPYAGKLAGRCWSCDAITRAQDELMNHPDGPPARPSALHYIAQRITRAPRARRARRSTS